jgi:hypothetical protein
MDSSPLGENPDSSGDFEGNLDSPSPSSLMKLISTRTHLEEKRASASETSIQYMQREKNLRDQLTELRLKAESICLKLEEEKSRLTDLRNQWRDELDRLPSIEFLEEQLDRLQQISAESALDEDKAKSSDIFVDLGILKPGDDLNKLPGMLLELSSGLSKEEVSDSDVEGCSLERRIALMKLVGKRLKEGSDSEIRMMEEENFWLDRELKRLEERKK